MRSYIFSDLERIRPDALAVLGHFWQQLEALPHSIQLLNHPQKFLKRIPLLKLLYQMGINNFNIYPLVRGEFPQPERFPVFIRQANDHSGPRSELIYTQADLEQQIELMQANKTWGNAPIVTEFVDVVDAAGIYKKFGAYRIGDKIIPTHILLENNWVVKDGDLKPEPSYIDEELDYVQNNPHEKQLMHLFELAHIDYGRIDYAFSKDGRMQVFEINTNPELLGFGEGDFATRLPRRKHVRKELESAFRALF